MSVINNALTDIAKKDDKQNIGLKKAQITPVQSSKKWLWAVGGFVVSLCLGGWAVSQQTVSPVAQTKSIIKPESVIKPEPVIKNVEPVTPPPVPSVKSADISNKTVLSDGVSPTAKVVNPVAVTLYSESPLKPESSIVPTATKQNVEIKKIAKSTHATASENIVTEPVAQVNAAPIVQRTTKQEKNKQEKAKQEVAKKATVTVKQVKLTPQQLAAKAIERGKKELSNNNLGAAIEEFEAALRYTPSNERNRKRLAALYYGKRDTRKAINVLQRGIRLNADSQPLRLALSNLLIKEGQPMPALNPLLHLPASVSVDYLAMRAGLAQQLKNDEVAYESYHLLTQKEDENARWWLGLAIQQERKQEYLSALHSYQQAMERVGVSKQTLTFIQNRIKWLNSLEEISDAN